MGRGRVLAAVAVAVLGTAAAGCGGREESAQPAQGEGRFLQHGFDITFAYPREFVAADDLLFGNTAGTRDSARSAVGLDRDNVIVVSRYELRRPVTHANVASVNAEVDGVIAKLSGAQLSGRAVVFGGLPGYEYAVSLPDPERGRSRVVVLFDRAVEYFFNCQSTPEARYVVDAACRQALGTLELLDRR